MSYRPLRISELSGTPAGYGYVDSDAFHVTCGTVTSGPSLSSVKLTFSEHAAWLQSSSNTSALWVSAGHNAYNTNSGLVGVGTSEPVHKLTVAGGVSGMKNVVIGGALSADGGGYNYFATRVGIGTTTPGTALEVGDGTSSESITINKSTAGTGTLYFDNAGGNKVYFQADADEHLRIATNNAVAMSILESGNVGIGDNSPGTKLDVKEGTAATCFVTIDAATDNYDSGIILQSVSTNKWHIINDSDDSDKLQFRGDGDSGDIFVTVGQDGKVGIGTTSPGEMLTVNRNSGNSLLSFETNDTPKAYIGVSNDADGIVTGSTAGDLGIRVESNDILVSLNGGSTAHVVFKADGKVGIGTLIPAATLDVTGTDAIVIPAGTTAQRPTGEDGMIRYNSTLKKFEGYHTNDQGQSIWCGLGGISDSDQDTYIEAHAADDTDDDIIHFYTANEEQLRLGDGALYPDTDNDVDLGTATLRFKNIHTYDLTVYDDMTISDDLTINGDLAVNGNTTIGNACTDTLSVNSTTTFNCNVTLGDHAADTITVTGLVGSNFIPSADSSYDLGSSTRYWAEGYIDKLYVTNTDMVANLNADRVDSIQASEFVTDFDTDNNETLLMHKDSTGTSTEVSRLTIPYASNSGTVNGHSVNQDLNTTSCVRFKCIGVNTSNSTTGTIKTTGDITAFVSSDIRLKENIFSITDPLDKLAQIRGVEYDWTDDHIETQGGLDEYFMRKHDVGVIAQEVEEVLPEVVGTRDDGTKAVRYEKLVPLLIEAVKELTDRVKELENR